MKITSQPLTFLDTTDSRKLEVYISSNHPTIQLYDVNDKEYTPDWSTTNLKLSADVFLDSTEKKPEKMKWYRQYLNETTEVLVSSGDYTEEITINTNMSQAVITYICRVEYQGLHAFSKITFTRNDTGLNGTDGKDGTSVRILGAATAKASTAKPGYYEITYHEGAVTAAALGDAYIHQSDDETDELNGHLFVCTILNDSATGNDFFLDGGNIQGPAGKDGADAKSIILTSTAQVFKVDKDKNISPSQIVVTAQLINIQDSQISWSYNLNDGKGWVTTLNGVAAYGRTVNVTKSVLTTESLESLSIKASYESYSDIFTIYKVYDGVKGDSASMAFLTNENISFAANASGQVSLTALTTNVVAYRGTEKVMPTIGTPSGVPSGMTIAVDSTSLSNSAKEAILTISIANNTTLGSASSNHGTVTIPITSPVSTNLLLSWSKINTGATGVGISSTTVTYGVSDSSSTQPAEWQSTIPVVADGKYLWTRTVIDYTDPSKADTVTYTYAKQGTAGVQGNPGTSVTVSSIQYQAGTSATTAPTGTWSDAVVSVADGGYLWTKTTFSDGKTAYGVAKQGVSGRGVSSITEYYLATTASSGVTTSTSGWTATIQTIDVTKKYLWNYELITYTDNTTSTTTPVIIGVFGNTGNAGKGIKSVTEYYLATTLSSDVTTSTTGWTTTMQALTEINKYLWNYELITYTDNTTTTINPIIIGVYGDAGTPGRPGSDAVTFQVYSSNGYALSINTPTVTLQTFAYIGDVAITADATYQWYIYNDTGWTELSGETNAYLTITREDVAFSKSYMCKMTFDGMEYTGVATIDDKNDENKVFTTKPSNYAAGDLWIVGVDYAPSGVEAGTLLRAEHTNLTYEDADWVTATKYDDKINELQDNIKTYNQYFSFDSTEGLKISAKDDNGTPSQFSTSLTNERLSFNYGNEAIAYINGTKMNIKEAEIESPLTVTGKYSGSTMLQAPVINIGNFSIIVESNGSLSIVANT